RSKQPGIASFSGSSIFSGVFWRAGARVVAVCGLVGLRCFWSSTTSSNEATQLRAADWPRKRMPGGVGAANNRSDHWCRGAPPHCCQEADGPEKYREAYDVHFLIRQSEGPSTMHDVHTPEY